MIFTIYSRLSPEEQLQLRTICGGRINYYLFEKLKNKPLYISRNLFTKKINAFVIIENIKLFNGNGILLHLICANKNFGSKMLNEMKKFVQQESLKFILLCSVGSLGSKLAIFYIKNDFLPLNKSECIIINKNNGGLIKNCPQNKEQNCFYFIWRPS